MDDPIIWIGIPLLTVWGVMCIFFRSLMWAAWVWMSKKSGGDVSELERTAGWDRAMIAYGIMSLGTVALLVMFLSR